MQAGSNGEKAGETEGETPEDGKGSQHEVCMRAAMIVHKKLRSFAGREALRNVNKGKCIDQKVWCRTSPQDNNKRCRSRIIRSTRSQNRNGVPRMLLPHLGKRGSLWVLLSLKQRGPTEGKAARLSSKINADKSNLRQ